MKKILIYGATSAMAHHTAINFAKDECELYLVARNSDKLEIIKNDILAGYKTKIFLYEQDANDFNHHQSLFEEIINDAGYIDLFLIAHGTLPKQKDIQSNPSEIIKEYNTNALSIMSLSSIAADYFEKRKNGKIAVISSVAGDRGRMSNYIYGSAKAAVSSFLQGLRNRLYHSGVKVLTIKPGLVDSPMTMNIEKNFLFAEPKDVGRDIYNAILQDKDIVYVPSFWKLIMLIIRNIPESIFKKLKL